ncbi:rho GTPase-activating protein 44-like isoform X2 [Bolinopsis microptera]|uniref:rho GTPase-activating protein 44-like isoform X2 n=1 Tax=Bolinopsis microptera TaxID=2820187 RepID=UPI0030799141
MSALQKGFYRLKQQVTETVDKTTNKTAALSSELVEVEENVRKIKIVYTDALKRAQESLPSYQHFKNVAGAGNVDAEKRMRKQTTWALGNTLVEGSKVVEEEHFLFDILKSCGDTLVLMAKQSVRFEYDLHEQVITPMQTILSEIKEIEILKKKLSNARLDMDSANNTLAKRKSHKGTEGDAQLLSNAENATNQFQMAQDTYITALLSFSSKELDHIKPLQCLLTCQQRMYNDVSKILNAKLPGLQDNIEKSVNTPVFGSDLDKHLETTGKQIASVLHRCCNSLLKSGIEQPGIFRLAGGLPQLRKLKAMFDSNRMEEEDWENDVFTLAQAIKLYLRELPEPLLTFTMFEQWIACIGNPNISSRVPRCRDLVQKLPNSFQVNLQYLIWFLSQVAGKEPENKMGASNLGLVLGPNVLRTKNEDDSDSITALNASSSLVELMIKNYVTIFPDPLPADSTRMSLPRSMTISGAINSSRPSVRTHKKGKAPTPKRPNNAPAPPPRMDLNKSDSVPVLSPSTPAKPVQASTECNPFGDSDDDSEKTPDPPKRHIEGKSLELDVSIPVPSAQADDSNPFNSPTPDETNITLEQNIKETRQGKEVEEDLNPFGDSDSEEVVSTPASPAPPKPPVKRPQPPSPPSKPVLPPSRPFKSDDVVNIENTASPTFSRSNVATPTPTHSRNASNTSVNSDTAKKHSQNPSDSVHKPAPPPRPSLEQ